MRDSERDKIWRYYLLWNQEIAEYVFPVGNRGKPVYLQIDDKGMSEIARRLDISGDPNDDLREAVHSTLALNADFGVFVNHLLATADWYKQNMGLERERPEPPPCLALLRVFVMAAERMRSSGGKGGNNYYSPLLEELRLPSSQYRTLRPQIAKDFRKISQFFWLALKDWLDAWEWERGKPTAAQVGGYRHVGVPLSQSLVREQDRLRLKEFFAEQEYNPSSPPDRSRLEEDLDRWIHKQGSPASSPLRQLWDRGDRNAIADIVEQELGSWEGLSEDPGGVRGRALRVRLAIQFERRGISKKPALYAIVSANSLCDQSSSYHLQQCQAETHETHENVHSSLRMERLSLPGCFSIEPAYEVVQNLEALEDLQLLQPDLDVRLKWSAREAIPLAWDSSSGLFVEQDRMERDREFLVLCREELSESARALLEDICGQEIKSHAGEYGDIPEGWTLFLSACPKESSPSLSLDTSLLYDLIPEPRYFFRINGGVQLPGHRTWHVFCPPEIAAVAEDQEAMLDLACCVKWSPHIENGAEWSLGRSSAFVYISQSQCSDALCEGDFDIALYEGDSNGGSRYVTRAAVHLRSGDNPRALGQNESRCLACPLDPKDYIHLATGVDANRNAPSGPLLVGAQLFEGSAEALERHPGRKGSLALKDAAPGPQAGRRDGSAAVPAFLDGHDLLLDALTYARAGSWTLFRRMANQIRAQRGLAQEWFAFRALDRLQGLGYIEIVLDRAHLRPLHWCIAPATLVVAPSRERAFLAGYRSNRLLRPLESAVRELGGSVEKERPHPGPMVLAVSGLHLDDIRLAASVASDDSGIYLSVQEDAPWRLAESSPTLNGMLDSLPVINLPEHKSLETFDTVRDEWRRASWPLRPGAYRVRGRPALYGIAAREDLQAGRMRVARPSWTRLLGLAFDGIRLAAYNRADSALRSIAGVPLPGLLERALVLCSGRLPIQEGRQRVYPEVPQRIGALVESRLNEIQGKGD